MESKIKLQHPQGKKAVSMEASKYNILKSAVIESLKSYPEITHNQLIQSVADYFKTNNIVFEGSVNWHLEWVKLDMEARNEIKRIGTKSPVKYSL